MIQRRVEPPRPTPCDEGCYDRQRGRRIREGSETHVRNRQLFDCLECGTFWKALEIGDRYSRWHMVSDKQQARYDRRKMRKAPEYAPFMSRVWRLVR